MLREKKITLLDPQTWIDSNDSHYVALYKKKLRYRSVLALCFTSTNETFHHWHVFAPGSGGVRIEFNGPSLIDRVKRPGIRSEAVSYLTISTVRDNTIEARDLPFLKRYPYENEQEFRLIYQSKTRDLPFLDIPIDLDCIKRIVLSPWLNENLRKHLAKVIQSIKGCGHIPVHRSTLIGNDVWKALGEKATVN